MSPEVESHLNLVDHVVADGGDDLSSNDFHRRREIVRASKKRLTPEQKVELERYYLDSIRYI